ncbi:hypothetical protein [[Kitasatospora] papulosa]|uniref:hypothetical protein n=1 Tax=[Kitasatospora] papulosa TaxID=1464011 RepID=UPI003857610E
MKTPDGIHALAYALLALGGDGIRAGRTGIRITLSPVPIHADKAHEQCYSVDVETDGLNRILDRLNVPAAQSGTEAA